jgi:mannonate dehydratase
MDRRLQYSWRWFGNNDPISLDQVRQTGAVSVVSALHQVPIGEVWSMDQILERKQLIEAAGLKWTVVESVPVHEDIKLRTGKFEMYIENYIQTIINLGDAGTETLCYNFMPVLDWSRTKLNYKIADGSESLLFDYISFAIIDIYILRRPGARQSYPEHICLSAEGQYKSMSQKEIKALVDTFLLGLPGSGETFSIESIREKIQMYSNIDNEHFKANLFAFIQEIAPAAEEAGIKLAIHPDDPPWSLMGLPKAISTLEDAGELVASYNSPANGITFCTGSFGAAVTNDLPDMVKKLAERINFVHLRNVSRDDHFNFHEDTLFEGDIDVAVIMESLVFENLKRYKSIPGYAGIPVRPDHGARILDDFKMNTYPGYPLYGRLKNLSEIIGLETGILHFLKLK